MLGRLARMLRLLGYDTFYSPAITTAELREVAQNGSRVVLTRGNAEKRFPALQNVFSVKSEKPSEQLCEVVRQFRLDTQAGLWTRCTLCNGAIEEVERASLKPLVEPKIFRLYQEFFRCCDCGHIYWRGSHVDRILKNLATILNQPESG